MPKPQVLRLKVILLPLFLIACYSFLLSGECLAQQTDTLHSREITLPVDSLSQSSRKKQDKDLLIDEKASVREHSPKKALIMSAIIPGLGQVYNKKYWKPPIIYAGLGTGIYFIDHFTTEYKYYKKAYLSRFDNDPSTDMEPGQSTEGLRTEYVKFRGLVETAYIATGLLYFLNLVDATVDAHLFHFDVSDDLSLDVHPRVLPGPAPGGMAPGVGITMRLHK